MSDTSKELVVQQKLKIVPERRTAEYSVPLPDGAEARARVNRGNIGFEAAGSYTVNLPKSVGAVNAVIALFEAVRDELVVQGVES